MTDLTTVRYKVIGGYPYSPFRVGDILSPDETQEMYGKQFDTGYVASKQSVMLADISIYPHLFQRLEWWQERPVSEMPEYIKPRDGDDLVSKVDKWELDEHSSSGLCIYIGGSPINPCMSNIQPATKSEYEMYLTNNSKH